MIVKQILKKIPFLAKVVKQYGNLHIRTKFVAESLLSIPKGSKILDAGCGSQQFRIYCSHLDYKAQDFGQYKSDEKDMFDSNDNNRSVEGYKYGHLDYIGDIWSIDEVNDSFDAILCTEVFEHIPYPNLTVKEFSRLLRSGGLLVLTLPSNCLRHMDPYFFYSGFSDRWLQTILDEHGFDILEMHSVGDYYNWMAAEIWRTLRTHSIFLAPVLLPALLFYTLKKPTEILKNSLVSGYHVIARLR